MHVLNERINILTETNHLNLTKRQKKDIESYLIKYKNELTHYVSEKENIKIEIECSIDELRCNFVKW